MKNNKGQTLTIFVMFLPLLIIMIFGIYKVGNIYYEKNNLDNINIMVLNYGIKNIDDIDINNKIKDLINKNDKDIVIKKIDIKNNNIEINLEKRINLLGKKYFNIKSYYIGNNKEIKKG